MRANTPVLLASLAIAVLFGGADLFAQLSTIGPVRAATGWKFLAPAAAEKQNGPEPLPGWLKNVRIRSFGYDLTPQVLGFQFLPGYTAALFNLQGLECPACVLGPRNRARFTLPPFGAEATLKLRDGRVELFAGFGGIEAWKADGTFEPKDHRLSSNSDGDAWLAQIQAGGRVALDHHQHVWLGTTSRYLYNFGPGLRQWSTFSGDATFRLGH